MVTNIRLVIFFDNFSACGLVYYITRKTLKKYEKEFAQEIKNSTKKRKTVLENFKIVKNFIIL